MGTRAGARASRPRHRPHGTVSIVHAPSIVARVPIFRPSRLLSFPAAPLPPTHAACHARGARIRGASPALLGGTSPAQGRARRGGRPLRPRPRRAPSRRRDQSARLFYGEPLFLRAPRLARRVCDWMRPPCGRAAPTVDTEEGRPTAHHQRSTGAKIDKRSPAPANRGFLSARSSQDGSPKRAINTAQTAAIRRPLGSPGRTTGLRGMEEPFPAEERRAGESGPGAIRVRGRSPPDGGKPEEAKAARRLPGAMLQALLHICFMVNFGGFRFEIGREPSKSVCERRRIPPHRGVPTPEPAQSTQDARCSPSGHTWRGRRLPAKPLHRFLSR